MPSRDSQTVILSRQTILLVTAVGVGLLTLCYVLGVQVGKQSAALRRPAARGSGEDLQELPASIADQLKALQSAAGPEAGFQQPVPADAAPATPAAAAPPPGPAAQPAPPVEVRMPPAGRPDPGKQSGTGATGAAPQGAGKLVSGQPSSGAAGAGPSPEKKADAGVHWVLQVVSTPDQDEAQRVAVKVRAAGFPAAVVADKGLFKVRLISPGAREAVDAIALKLKVRGFKPFAIKVE